MKAFEFLRDAFLEAWPALRKMFAGAFKAVGAPVFKFFVLFFSPFRKLVAGLGWLLGKVVPAGLVDRLLRRLPRPLRPLLLDRYLFKSFIVTYVASAFLFVVIVLLFELMNDLKVYLPLKTPAGEVLGLYLNKSFLQFTMVSPAAALFAALFTIYSLARTNELVAIVNSGMSMYRLSASILLFGAALSVFLVWFNNQVVFPAERRAQETSQRLRMPAEQRSKNQADLKVWGADGLFYKIQIYDDGAKMLRGLVVLRLAEGWETAPGARRTATNLGSGPLTNVVLQEEVPEFLVDVRGLEERRLWLFRIEAEYARHDPARGGWVLHNGRLRKYAGGRETTFPFKERFFPLKEQPFDFARETVKIHAMTTAEASRHIDKMRKAGQSPRKELVEYHMKYAFPFANLIIILIGVSFGGFSPRSVMVLSFFIAVIVYLLYYTFIAVGLSMGKIGALPPLVGAWLGNLGFLVIGGVLLAYRKT